jgi:hypothetical protein
MVDLHSVAASSHPSHRERESERETTCWSRAGRSQWPKGRTDTTTVVLESQSQPTARTTASLPAAVGPIVALLVARQLLNNPPPARASPSAAEQWHHDADQLVIATINTPHRDGWHQPSTQQSCFPSTAREPSVAQAPPVLPGARPPTQHRASIASYQTSDLRRKSTTVEVGRTVAPPSSATVRGIETSSVTTSREISTCMH